MVKKPILWTMTDEEIIEELDRFAYWFNGPYTAEQKALAVIAEAIKRLLKKKQ